MERVFFFVVTDFGVDRVESIYTALSMYRDAKEFYPGDKVSVYKSHNHILNKEEAELICSYLYLPQELPGKVALSKWGFGGQTV